jgi:hypothetical protein
MPLTPANVVADQGVLMMVCGRSSVSLSLAVIPREIDFDGLGLNNDAL